MLHPPWLATAALEIGVRTFPAGSSNPRVTAYHDCTSLRGYDDKASWCSSFVNWSLAQVGIEGTGSALARSWLEWGQRLEAPRFGCIAVLSRDGPGSWKGHVGFFLHADAEHVHLLGGNQLDAVCLHTYPLSCVLSYRWPTGLGA
jgi:uncharacterized protein (TIGR02594 family)